MSRRATASALALFAVVLGATTLFLWHAHAMGPALQIAAAAGIVGALWLVGRVSEPGTRGRADASVAPI